MKMLTLLATLLLICTGCTNEAEQISEFEDVSTFQTDAQPPADYKEAASPLQRVDIVDAQGFGVPIPAISVAIPRGWRTRGGIVWQVNQRGCGLNGTRIEWQATAPDGSSQISFLPEETWSGNNQNKPQKGGCPNFWVTNVKQFMENYIQRNRAGAKIISYRPRRDIEQEYQQLNQTSAFPGGESRTWVESGEALLEYSINGRPFNEALAFLVVFRMNRFQGGYMGQEQRFLTVSTMPGFSFITPKGAYNESLAEAIRTSGRPYPEWSRRMQEHNLKMANINRKGAIARHNIRMNTNREISEINRRGFENRQAIRDKGYQKLNRAIRDVDLYRDTTTGEKVELSHDYKHAWKLEDGSYYQTNDAMLQPYRDLGVDGRQMELAE